MRLPTRATAAPTGAGTPTSTSDASVGIFINKHTSLFQNGCVQQSVFLYKLFQTAFRAVDLVTVERDLTHFDAPFDHVPVRLLTDGLVSDDGKKPRYDVIVFVSGVLMDPAWLRAMQRVGTACVRLVCGNMYWLNQEEYVFGVHGVTAQNMMADVREQWVLPMYAWSASYMRLLSSTDVHVTPYVWDPDIIEHVARRDGLQIRPRAAPDSSKVVLVIMEPNLSVHKTSLVPMLVANFFHRGNPDRLAHVHHFCADDLVKRASVVLSNLEIQRAGLVTHYHRMSFPHVMHAVLSHGHRAVVLSHVNQNDLNFLHLECMHLGVPIVHNCPPFEDNGLLYSTEDLAEASRCVARAAATYDSTETLAAYRARCDAVLQRYSSKNQSSAAEYVGHVDRLRNDSLAARHDFFRRRAEFFRSADAMFVEQAARRAGRGGRGVVICADGALLVSQAMLALTALRRAGCGLPVEIVSAPGALDPAHRRALSDARFGDVRFLDIGTFFAETADLRGFQIKPLALVASSFDEILFMDCDVISIRDPSRWFDAAEYRESGHLFCRDYFQYGVHENPYSTGTTALAIAMGVDISTGHLEVDSGLFVIDKVRCARAVTYAAAMALMHDFFYKIMYGDKESFRLAFGLSGQPFRVTAKMPGIAGTRALSPPTSVAAPDGIAGWGMAHWSPDSPSDLSHVHCTIRKYTRDDHAHVIDSIQVLTDDDSVGMGFVKQATSIPMLWRAARPNPPPAVVVPAPADVLRGHLDAWRPLLW